MIADKIIPSFYIIELKGDAVKTVIPEDYGIEKISISSGDFSSDMHANEKLDVAIENILSSISGSSNLQVALEFNPEFLPKEIEEQNDEVAEANRYAEDMSAQLIEKNQVAIAITRQFDPLGDFVIFRKNYVNPKFHIAARVVANVEEYVKAKSLDQFAKVTAVNTIGHTQYQKMQIH